MDPARNIHARGYVVYVGKNSRDNGYQANADFSNNVGADIHITTHSNGVNGCGNPSASYFLVMFKAGLPANPNQCAATSTPDPQDKALANKILANLGPAVAASDAPTAAPASCMLQNYVTPDEMFANAPSGVAYVELQFHDNQTAQSWIYDKSRYAAWRYGLAIDQRLNYP